MWAKVSFVLSECTHLTDGGHRLMANTACTDAVR